MIKIICAKVAAAFPPLPPLPIRPLLGAGATVGPVRPAVVCVALLCGSATGTAPPHLAERIPSPAPPPAAWRDGVDHLSPVAVPAPGALALFGLGLGALMLLRRRTQ